MKLAGYQLPFDGAWAVKVFQAAVAAGAQEEIRVTLGRRVVVFHFESTQPWELDEVEEAFFNPEPSTVRHVKNLVSGLWAVGVGEKRAFQLRLEGAGESLVWNGETCQRRPLKQSQKGVELVVTHAQGKSIADWLSDTVEAGRRNSRTAVSPALFRCSWTDNGTMRFNIARITVGIALPFPSLCLLPRRSSLLYGGRPAHFYPTKSLKIVN